MYMVSGALASLGVLVLGLRGLRLFLTVRGTHPIARLRSLGSYPPNPLAKGASLFFFSPRSGVHFSSHRRRLDLGFRGFGFRV